MTSVAYLRSALEGFLAVRPLLPLLLAKPDFAKTDLLPAGANLGPENDFKRVDRLQEDEGELRGERFSSLPGMLEREGVLA